MNLKSEVGKICAMKEENRFFIYDDMGKHFKNLIGVSEKDLNLKVQPAEEALDIFANKLNEYCNYLINHGLPFDFIDVSSDPGILIKGSKHLEVMESFIIKKYRIEQKEEVNDFDYFENINIDDTPGIVPFNFNFTPWYDYEKINRLLKTLYYAAYEMRLDGFGFKIMVNFDEFVKLLDNNGYTLYCTSTYFSDSIELHNYEDYFKSVFKNRWSPGYQKVLTRISFKLNNK